MEGFFDNSVEGQSYTSIVVSVVVSRRMPRRIADF